MAQRSAEHVLQAGDEGREIEPDSRAYLPQFEDIETPLPGLELADEGLRLIEAFGYLLLRQPSLRPHLPKQG